MITDNDFARGLIKVLVIGTLWRLKSGDQVIICNVWGQDYNLLHNTCVDVLDEGTNEYLEYRLTDFINAIRIQ